MEKKTVGFVGLGAMGSGMVKNLLSADFPVIGYDIDQHLVDGIVKMGAKGLDAPEKMASQVDLILLSLPNSYVVNEVVNQSLRLFETGRKGLIVIDTTTADPALSEGLALQLREKEIEMLDATVSGSSKMCAERDVIFMVGGNERTFEECKPLLSAMGKRVFYIGPNGAGAQIKLIVNLIGSVSRMLLAEGLALGKKAGIDLYTLLEVLKSSHAYSKAMDMKGMRMIEKNFLPAEGKMIYDLKDSRLMLDLGKRLNFPLFLTSIFSQACASEVSKGRGDRDVASIISFYEDLASL